MNVNLDRRISIERRSVTQESTYNTDVVTWVLVATVYAEVRDVPPSRSEAVRQGIAQARNQVRIRIRYRSDLDSSMRIRFGDRTLQIVGGPAELGRREWTELVAEEISTDGNA